MSVIHFSKSFELAIFSLWDKLEANKKLEKSEFLDLVEAAFQEAQTNIEQNLETKLVTKDFLRHTLSETENRLELKIQAQIAQNKADIIKWCITSQVAVGGMIVALVKLL